MQRPLAADSALTAREADRSGCLRVAAAGDVHCAPGQEERIRSAFAQLRGRADLVLLAGDLTTHGEPEQAAVLAAAAAELDVPILAVLGNHDWHSNRVEELVPVLQDGGISLLQREHVILQAGVTEVGVVGCKGFVGGFPGSHLPDFGEPLLREVYAENTAEVEALDRGLREIAVCPARIVLLHYAPIPATIAGEPPGIWAFLGSDRLAGPIAQHEPDLVLHGHAHSGAFEGRVGGTPVYNVSVPVMGQDFWLFEIDTARPAASALH
jgi:Icc-related predicted phosphoesterase